MPEYRFFNKAGFPQKPDNHLTPEGKNLYLTSEEYLADRRKSVDRRIKNTSDLEVQSGGRERTALRFAREGLELQQKLFAQFEALKREPSEEMARTMLEEIDRRLAVLQGHEQDPTFARRVGLERGELTTLREAIGASKPQKRMESVPPSVEKEAPEEDRKSGVEQQPLPEAEKVTWVMLPPDAMEHRVISGEGEDARERPLVPRVETLRALLKEKGSSYREVVGEVDPQSRRKTSYHGFAIPDLHRIVFVNDSYGNATFVMSDTNTDLEKASQLSKDGLRMFTDAHRLTYPGDMEKWRAVIEQYLTNALDDRERIGRDHLSIAKLRRILDADYDIGIRNDVLTHVLEKIAELSGDVDGTYRRATASTSRTGNVIYEYDPVFAERALDAIVGMSKPNERWRTVKGLMTDINARLQESGHEGIDYMTLKAMIDDMYEAVPESELATVRGRFMARGAVSEAEQEQNPFGLKAHYSPEFCSTILDRVLRETPPKEWKTINALRERLRAVGRDRTDADIRAKMEELSTRNPEEFATGHYRESGPRRKSGEPLKLFMHPTLEDTLYELFTIDRAYPG